MAAASSASRVVDIMNALAPAAKRLLPTPKLPLMQPPLSPPPAQERKRPRMEYLPEDEKNFEAVGSSMKQDWIDCLTVEVNYEVIPEDLSEEVRAALEVLPGRYWKVGHLAASVYSVYRQEQPFSAGVAAPNCKELYFHFRAGKDGGWFIAPSVLTAGPPPLAWGKADRIFIPEQMHVPYWAKKVCPYIRIIPYHTWCELKIHALLEETYALKEELTNMRDAEEDEEVDLKGKGSKAEHEKGKDIDISIYDIYIYIYIDISI
jgi:hypothetical protein